MQQLEEPQGEEQQQQQGQDQDDDLMIPLNVQARLAEFTDRYFVKSFSEHQYVFQHSNRLYLSGINKNHPIVKSDSDIKEIEFTQKEQHVKGKKKKGGLKVKSDTVMLKVHLENGEVYNVVAGHDGYIIEMNENLQKNKQYLKQYPETKGFVCIIQGCRK
ncbi:unnamed protein product (macronuclear) [Paramecium tetraurelia]|uniref:Protein Abitram n=1 Tax=Paramecium tetraurelia TaxID=5888 RepID=A0BN85_PARTE|nr:uncharacterized protein GSPATT00030640001 [Paramecium tetraurelia]CAK60002.1 unnamed protein product [Paramecium tetraurelia]|eukprot:XP_001427400.1 hypothetical protein (macronuclear) [Paramecium tetraurelia strain d4-2]